MTAVPAWHDLPQCYDFDTGTIRGGIQPYTNYHGVNGLMHKDWMVGTVHIGKAFLNAEYYLRPGSGMVMYPRRISLACETEHETGEHGVRIAFPVEPEYGLTLELIYRPAENYVDMEMRIVPGKSIPKFEIFFASYVVEAFDETWVPLRGANGEEWKLLDNRVELGRTFGIVRDDSARELLQDGRYGRPKTGLHEDIEDLSFSRSILVARCSANGLSLVFLCDPLKANYLCGQYHGWDTAHDWSYGQDLVADEEMVAQTRLVYARIQSPDRISDSIDPLWEEFTK